MENAQDVGKTSQESDTDTNSTVIAVCGCGHDGRLGIGSNESQSRVVVVPFFLGTTDGDGRPLGSIRAARVGGYHNFVITTEGVYGWGLNEDGQLGLGRGSSSCISVPTRIPFLDGKCIKDIACGAHHTFAWTSDGLYACGRNEDGQLGLPSRGAYFSFTMVLSNSQANVGADDGGSEVSQGACSLIKHGQLTHVSCGTHHTLLAFRDVAVLMDENVTGDNIVKFSVLVAAAGKGDFGELGYDGDAWSILQSKAKTMQTALESAARRNQNGFPENGTAPELVNDVQKHWKPLKQRRAPFSSDRFQPVGLSVLLPCHNSDESAIPYEVVSLNAMHLHSAIALRELHTTEGSSSSSCDTRTFHWGCYYCGDVEDDASSVPREEERGTTLHAGNEIIFRYRKAPSSEAVLEVKGDGVLGLGEEDSRAKTWVPLPLPPGVGAVDSVRTVVGRDHFLIQLSDSVVVGFGDNMHGQLAAGSVKDSLLTPSVVIRNGNELMVPVGTSGVDFSVRWRVERVADVVWRAAFSLCVGGQTLYRQHIL
uniref:Uncharacterized protein TCIL3000_11_7340 n=1 Tax=Trypanosoma congolense (strain IL3000) TaxID=1068625 RepID=G0V0Y0_TRYCI|nr:unnamed protein product [Trypanosoma congolense IL3000]